MNGNDDNKRIGLLKAVEAGAKAADVQRFLLPIIDNRKHELVDNLESENFYYQKIDNSELLAIQLELKVLKRIRSEIATLIATGEEATEELRSMDQPKAANKASRPLRF